MDVATTTTETNRELRLPARSGRVMPAAARALHLASLCASRDQTRPVLCDVLWEGGDDLTRAVGTDTYRLIIVEVERTRAGVKPPPGRSWGLHAAAVRQAYRLQTWRRPELGFGICREDQTCVLVDGDGMEHVSEMGGLVGYEYPNWPKVMPDPEAWQWRASVRLGELAQLMRTMTKVYNKRGEWGPRVVCMPDDGLLTVWPSLELRQRTDWPPQWTGGALPTIRQDVRADHPVAINPQLAAEPLWRAAEWLGDDQEVDVIAYPGLGPLEISIADAGACRRLQLIVMPMVAYEVWGPAGDPQCDMTRAMMNG